MKKFKKLLAGLLTGAMLLGSMSVSAFAADTTASKTPVIDENEKGSITIHKYEYNGTVTTHGTGETTDVSMVPEEAKQKPLQGAGFTIYKVADVNDLITYYSEKPTALPVVGDYIANGKIIDGKIKPGFKPQQQTTNENGETTFSNLELGFYVVIETTTPDKVTTPADPFLVSIPMTVKSGDNWLYDVHVYPKNKTTYGVVTLEKKGKNDVPLKGVTFVLQKKNGNEWTDVSKNESDDTNLNLITDENGQISVAGLSQGTYRFIETDRGADNGGYIMDGATTYEFTVSVDTDGKIHYTYNNKTKDGIDIKIVNEKPDITKEVKNGDKWDHKADYSVGDLVPYQIKVSVPANITKLKTFILIDTPTNLDDKIDSVAITADGAAIATTAYSVAEKGTNGFKIAFDPTKMSAYAGKEIIVTYNAELLASAVTTTDGNTNDASLEYSNKILPESTDPDKDNPNTPTKPVTPGTDKITDTTYVYTFKIQIVKTAESESGTPLKGVEFDLYKEVAKGTTGAATADEVKKAGLDSNKTWMKINTAPLKTDDKGTVSQSGLKNGVYYLVETKTNETYNLLKKPVEVNLKIDYAITTGTTTTTDSDGNVTIVKDPVTKTTFNNDENKTDGIQIQNVINKKGFTLPLTGGMGTVLFSVIGLALVLAGVVVITASRKKTAK